MVLCDCAVDAFRQSDREFLVEQLITELADVHELCLPEFSFPEGLQRNVQPDRLLWHRDVPNAERQIELPKWMKNQTEAPVDEPSEVELRIEEQDPELASVLERIVVQAATQDWSAQYQQADTNRREEQDAALNHLVCTITERVGISKSEVAELFLPRLIQHRAADLQECAATKQALGFLLSQLASNQEP